MPPLTTPKKFNAAMWEGQTLFISVLNPSLSLSLSLSHPHPRRLPLSHPYPRRLKTPSFMAESHFFHYHLPLSSQINAMATFMAALRSFSSMGTIRDAGPKMQTILVFGIQPLFGSSFNIPSMSMFAISLWFQIRRSQKTITN